MLYKLKSYSKTVYPFTCQQFLACAFLKYSTSAFQNSCLLGPEQKNSRKYCCGNFKFPTSTFCSSEAWVFETMTLTYQCNVNTKCTYLCYAAETDSTEVFSLAVRDRFIPLLLLLLILLLQHLIFLGLYTQNLVRTTFISEEIFYIIIFKQATGFLDQLNKVKPLLQFFSKVCFSQHN